MAINIEITGNLIKDPELSYTQSGKALCRITVASNEYHRAKDGSGVEEDGVGIFKEATFWEDEAEYLANELHKGDSVIIIARLRGRTGETRSGEKRTFEDLIYPKIYKALRAPRNGASRSNNSNRGSYTPPEPPQASSDDTPF